MSLQMAMSLRVQQTCSADMVQYAALLALDLEQLEDAVRTALADNPLLESASEPCTRCGWRSCAGTCGAPRTTSSPVATAADGETLVLPADARLEIQQRARLELPRSPAAVVALLVESCDERGILVRPLSCIVRELGLDSDHVREALDWLRRELGPAVGADDLVDSLCLQIRAVPPCPAGELAERLLRDHLDRLASDDQDLLAGAVGVSPEQIDDVLEFIRTRLVLYPSVFPGEAGSAARTTPPDVVVRLDPAGAGLVVDLADDRCGVRVRREVEQIPPADRTPEFRRQLELARSFASRLGRRRTTLRAIVETAVERRAAQVTGTGALDCEPLTRACVAATVGVHESTVSRAVAGRVLRRPDGSTVRLASLFDRSVGPKAAIAELITTETTPLSDQALSARLAERGYAISRRTVAKYRSELGIPSSSTRTPNSAAA